MIVYGPIPQGVSVQEGLDRRVDECIDYFSKLEGMQDIMAGKGKNRPRVTLFSPLERYAPPGVYQRDPNQIILNLNIHNRRTVAEEVGHWAYYEINQDPIINEHDDTTDPQTEKEHVVRQLHEMIGGLFGLIYSNGEARASMKKTDDKDSAIGYGRAIKLYDKYGSNILPKLIVRDYLEVSNFLSKETPIGLKEKIASIIRKFPFPLSFFRIFEN